MDLMALDFLVINWAKARGLEWNIVYRFAAVYKRRTRRLYTGPEECGVTASEWVDFQGDVEVGNAEDQRRICIVSPGWRLVGCGYAR